MRMIALLLSLSVTVHLDPSTNSSCPQLQMNAASNLLISISCLAMLARPCLLRHQLWIVYKYMFPVSLQTLPVHTPLSDVSCLPLNFFFLTVHVAKECQFPEFQPSRSVGAFLWEVIQD